MRKQRLVRDLDRIRIHRLLLIREVKLFLRILRIGVLTASDLAFIIPSTLELPRLVLVINSHDLDVAPDLMNYLPLFHYHGLLVGHHFLLLLQHFVDVTNAIRSVNNVVVNSLVRLGSRLLLKVVSDVLVLLQLLNELSLML